MAAKYGKNTTLVAANKKAGPGEVNGHVKTMYDEFTFLAEGSASDTIDMGAKLPKGARITAVTLKSPALGGTGTTDVGYAANGVDAAAPTAFIAAAATGAGVVHTLGTLLGMGKKFTAETQVQLTMTGVTTSATGKTLQVWVHYIVD